MSSLGPGRHCKGKIKGVSCNGTVQGQAQLCPKCLQNRTLCQGCGKPHGGIPGMTRFCPPCRSQRRRKPHSARNPPFTQAEDAIIREVYATHNSHDAPRILRERWSVRPSWSITRRAQLLGAATIRKKEPRWAAEEDAVLLEHAWMVPERVVLKLKDKGYHRTVTAVSIRMKRMGAREHIDGMSAHQLATMLDVDGHAVTGWIDAKELAAERRGTTGDAHDKWYITTAAVQAFFWAHPERVVLSRLERAGSKMWFLELVSGGRIREHDDGPAREPASPPTPGEPAVRAEIGLPAPARTVALFGERVTITALAEICGRSSDELLHRIDGLGMSVDGAAFGDGEAASEGAPAPATSLGVEAGKALGALMKRHRAKPKDVAGWTGLPEEMVQRFLTGQVTLLPAALLAAVEKLDGRVAITIEPVRHAWE